MHINEDALTGGTIGTAISFSGTFFNASEFAIWVNIGLGILGAIITLTTTIIIPVIKWYKNSKKDGKVSAEEMDELSKLIKEGSITLEEALNKIKENQKDA